jgi:hypothetical protein
MQTGFGSYPKLKRRLTPHLLLSDKLFAELFQGLVSREDFFVSIQYVSYFLGQKELATAFFD